MSVSSNPKQRRTKSCGSVSIYFLEVVSKLAITRQGKRLRCFSTMTNALSYTWFFVELDIIYTVVPIGCCFAMLDEFPLVFPFNFFNPESVDICKIFWLYYIIYLGKINTFMKNQKVATDRFVRGNFGVGFWG